jgi:acetate kinase
MGSRAGSVDPGILLHLLRAGTPLDELADGLDHRSGMVAVSGSEGGAREIEASAEAGDARAQLALDMFARRAATGIASMAAALDRLDALVFTGGIGENSATMRAAITERLAVLGIVPVRGTATLDAILSPPGAPVAVLRVEAREDLVIARGVRLLLGNA